MHSVNGLDGIGEEIGRRCGVRLLGGCIRGGIDNEFGGSLRHRSGRTFQYLKGITYECGIGGSNHPSELPVADVVIATSQLRSKIGDGNADALYEPDKWRVVVRSLDGLRKTVRKVLGGPGDAQGFGGVVQVLENVVQLLSVCEGDVRVGCHLFLCFGRDLRNPLIQLSHRKGNRRMTRGKPSHC